MDRLTAFKAYDIRGRIPDELTCRECHRDEAFRFASRLERIRHWE
mgnify:CR=1 FL=1